MWGVTILSPDAMTTATDISTYTGRHIFAALTSRVDPIMMSSRGIQRHIVDHLTGANLGEYTANGGAKLKEIGLSDEDVDLILTDLIDFQMNGARTRFDRVPQGTKSFLHHDAKSGLTIFMDYEADQGEDVSRKKKDDAFLAVKRVVNFGPNVIYLTRADLDPNVEATVENVVASYLAKHGKDKQAVKNCDLSRLKVGVHAAKV